MQIVKIGTWDKNGMPTGWHFNLDSKIEPTLQNFGAILTITEPGEEGKVLVDRVEFVEWTEARRKAMEPDPCRFCPMCGGTLKKRRVK